MMLPTVVFVRPRRQLLSSEALDFTTSTYRCPSTATVGVPRGVHQTDYLPFSRGPTRPSRPPTSPQRLTPATCQPPRSSGDKHPTSGIFETVRPCTNHNHMSIPGSHFPTTWYPCRVLSMSRHATGARCATTSGAPQWGPAWNRVFPCVTLRGGRTFSLGCA